MGVLSNRVDRESLKPGDHIYTWRAAYIYSHHGIYVEDNKVIHFTARGQEVGLGTVLPVSSGFTVPLVPCFTCVPPKKDHGVLLSCLNCFLAGDTLYRFEYNVTRTFFLAKIRGGTCSLAKSDSPEVVVHRAQFLLDNIGFGCYDSIKNNCEDFAIYCKTGLVAAGPVHKAKSGQVLSFAGAPLAAISSVALRLLTTINPYGLGAMSVGMYCTNRVATDVGVRTDMVKLEVEDLTKWIELSMQKSRQREGETGVLSNGIDRESLKPGDHIYTWRAAYFYPHHGIYVGDNKVIHFTRHGQQVRSGTVLPVSSSLTVPPVPCCTCVPPEKDHGVLLSCLNCFLAGDTLYRFEYLAKIGGETCSLAESDSSEIVVHRAQFLLDHIGLGCYDSIKNNCGDFAIYCKTGFVAADLVNMVGQPPLATDLPTPLRPWPTSLYGMYCTNRVAADVGMRTDVVKLEVEDLTKRIELSMQSESEGLKVDESESEHNVKKSCSDDSSLISEIVARLRKTEDELQATKKMLRDTQEVEKQQRELIASLISRLTGSS